MGWIPHKLRFSSLRWSLLAVALAAAVTSCRDSGDDTSEACAPPPEESGKYLVVTQIDAYYTSKGIECRPRDFNVMPVELIADGAGAPVSFPPLWCNPARSSSMPLPAPTC